MDNKLLSSILLLPRRRRAEPVPFSEVVAVNNDLPSASRPLSEHGLTVIARIMERATGGPISAVQQMNVLDILGQSYAVYAVVDAKRKFAADDCVIRHDFGYVHCAGPLVFAEATEEQTARLFFSGSGLLRHLNTTTQWCVPLHADGIFCEYKLYDNGTTAGVLAELWPVSEGRWSQKRGALLIPARELFVIDQTIRALVYRQMSPSTLEFIRVLYKRAGTFICQKLSLSADHITEVPSFVAADI